MALSLNQFLILYLWFPLAILLLFLLLIARFYSKFSGEQTYFRAFLLPLILFGTGVVRYASTEQMISDALADFIFGAAGIILIFLSLRLYRLMMARAES